jgi:hypothetical protein
MTLDPERQLASVDATRKIVQAALGIDAEALRSWLDIIESPLGKTMLPMILNEAVGELTAEQQTLLSAVIASAKLTLFYVEEVKKLYA